MQLLSEAGGAHWPLATYLCPFLGPFQSLRGGGGILGSALQNTLDHSLGFSKIGAGCCPCPCRCPYQRPCPYHPPAPAATAHCPCPFPCPCPYQYPEIRIPIPDPLPTPTVGPAHPFMPLPPPPPPRSAYGLSIVTDPNCPNGCCLAVLLEAPRGGPVQCSPGPARMQMPGERRGVPLDNIPTR